MNILIISNGYGEDKIGVSIIESIQKKHPEAKFSIINLVGNGFFYKQIDQNPLLKNPTFESGGFIRNLKSLIKDLKQGLLFYLFKQRKIIKSHNQTCDLTICIGDIFCLLMGGFKNPTPTYFLATAKSNTFMPHSKIEEWLIKKYSKLCFTRDQITAKALQKNHVPAQYLGNIMFDDLYKKTIPLPINKQSKTIALLPGSRQEAYANFEKQLTNLTLSLNTQTNLTFITAIAPILKTDKLQFILDKNQWTKKTKSPFIIYQKQTHTLLITTEFVSALKYSELVIGLAGTANEQAIYYGKTVLCFEGSGPQSTPQRFKEQEKLLGKKLIFLEKNIQKEILHYIQNTSPPPKKTNLPQEKSASDQITTQILASIKSKKNLKQKNTP